MFDEASARSGAPFPDHPKLRQLLRVDLHGRRFFLYGFQTRDVVCLRVAVRRVEGAGPQAACVSRADLRRSGDLVLPVKANMSVGHVGPIARTPSAPPTVPEYRLTFGLAAAEVERVRVDAADGVSAASVRNGAFLHVLQPGRFANWVRFVTATTADGRSETVPISVQNSHAPTLRTGLTPHGPASVERHVGGGKIGWFERREPRGLPARDQLRNGCCRGFARLIYPDRNDFLAIAVGDRSLLPPGGPHTVPSGGDVICHGLVSHGSSGSGCTTLGRLFALGPLVLGWGFSGAGQQIWIVDGLASDDVDRIEVYLGDGHHWPAPLQDNATVFRVSRAKFPIRVVAYDKNGRVIGIRTINSG